MSSENDTKGPDGNPGTGAGTLSIDPTSGLYLLDGATPDPEAFYSGADLRSEASDEHRPLAERLSA